MKKAWYSCKVKYQKIDPHGNHVKAADIYLIEAISYSDAETRLYEIMEQLVRVEFQVVAISKANFEDIINTEDGDDWYKIKASALSFDEDSGKERKIISFYLISASTIDDSLVKIKTYLDDSINDYVVQAISVTSITDVFPFDEISESLPVDRYQEDAGLNKIAANTEFSDDEELED